MIEENRGNQLLLTPQKHFHRIFAGQELQKLYSNISGRKRLLFFLKAGIALLAIFFLFCGGWLSTDTFVHFSQWDNIPIVIASCLFLALALLLSVFRLILLLRTINFTLLFFEGLRLNMIGLFFNSVLPGVLGGDFFRGYYLFRSEGAVKGKSLGILLMDRICGLLAIFLLGASSMVYLTIQQSRFLMPYRQETQFLLGGVLFFFALFGMIFILGRSPSIRLKIIRGISVIFRSKILQEFISGFGALVLNVRIFVYCFLISLAIQMLSLGGLLILGRIVIGSMPDIISMAAVSSLVIIISAIPVTPGNVGWTELLGAAAWSIVGSDAGAEIFLYWRIVTVLCSLPGSLLYLRYGETKSAEENQKKKEY